MTPILTQSLPDILSRLGWTPVAIVVVVFLAGVWAALRFSKMVTMEASAVCTKADLDLTEAELKAAIENGFVRLAEQQKAMDARIAVLERWRENLQSRV